MMTLGCVKPKIILYLPNRPLIPEDGRLDIPGLIQLNGNHWRKIFSIYAKLCCGSTDWRDYRDSQLLNDIEQISFADSLADNPASNLAEIDCWHLIAGKVSWNRLLGIDGDPQAHGFVALDPKQQVWFKGPVILTPYLDYRQFPNALVSIVTQILFDKSHTNLCLS